MRRISFLAFAIVIAGLAPASAQIVVNHSPHPFGGSASDLAFRDDFGITQWQQAADDFRIDESARVLAVNWWAWYRQDNPPDSESIRIRLYANRDTQDLPGDLLYECVLENPSRQETGRRIAIVGIPREFQFHALLPTPMDLDSARLYWLEITQLNDLASAYAAEYALADRNGRAFINGTVGDWQRTSATTDLAFQLIVPEPMTSGLVLLGAACIACRRPRQRALTGLQSERLAR